LLSNIYKKTTGRSLMARSRNDTHGLLVSGIGVDK
jgi:hypothetical protein